MGGTAATIQAEVSSDSIAVSKFYASCRGVYPDGRSCGVTVTGFNPRAAAGIGGGCAFTIEEHGDIGGIPTELTIRGSLDAGSCRVSGSYELQAGSCCSSRGNWSASKS